MSKGRLLCILLTRANIFAEILLLTMHLLLVIKKRMNILFSIIFYLIPSMSILILLFLPLFMLGFKDCPRVIFSFHLSSPGTLL